MFALTVPAPRAAPTVYKVLLLGSVGVAPEAYLTTKYPVGLLDAGLSAPVNEVVVLFVGAMAVA